MKLFGYWNIESEINDFIAINRGFVWEITVVIPALFIDIPL